MSALRLRRLGRVDYAACLVAMQDFTDRREADTSDELWLVQHPPVFTLGLAGKPEHVLDAGDIPVVRCDRGGQVTYHGPGQVVLYTLLDLKRADIGIKALVTTLEQTVIDLLAPLGLAGERRAGAPGVYVAGAKIAALGLRIRRACCYHGLSLNVAMDLTPFERINPCGYPGLAVTDLRTLAPAAADPQRIGECLASTLAGLLGRQLSD
ncbi:lipoyl(octanoyl) transferase LipB [Immundisolibacter cernigliae]|uniref:Octanoyltransferase n=1 Tax=Immundisolibacter cernigliae TaxID=1810504 RepID=A0A1B1YUT0_9GAMM|nr:lipoyl(octanoyl) transferase LipB [Immundisolibacter cernigliae]ANX04548.1 octanoyltransferase [Immundisolibacter cernigliae]